MLGGFILELGHAVELAHVGDAAEDPRELRVLMHVALNKQRRTVRVDAACDEQRRHGAGLLTKLGGIVADGQRVKIRDHVIAVLVVLLHEAPVAESPYIIAECGNAGGFNSA